MTSIYKGTLARAHIEASEAWSDEKNRTVPLKFHADWDVQIVPPFAGAMARFLVGYQDQSVSVYYDTNNSLGIESSPYYELYGGKVDDPIRVRTAAMTEEDISRQIFSILNGMLGDNKVYPESKSVEETKPEPTPVEVFEPCKHCGSTTVECLWDKQDDPPCG